MKVLIVDDHTLIRDGLKPVLRQLADPAVAGEVTVLEASSLADALAHAARHKDLDLILLDLHLPDVTGLEALDKLQAGHPEIPVVVMSGEEEPHLMRAVFDHGALGFIPKSSSSAVILGAVRVVLSGGTYLPREAIAADAPAAPQARGLQGADRLGLTPRQAEVLALLLAGKSNKQICRELGVAEGTVKNHMAAILKALGVTTRVEALVAAARLGIKS